MAKVIDFSIYNCMKCGRQIGRGGCSHCRVMRAISAEPARRAADPRKYLLIVSIVIIGLAISLGGIAFSMGK